MTETPDRRHELIERMADFLLANGLAAASLRPLAAAAGVSDRMLIYYFKTKSGAIALALDALLRRLAKSLEPRVTRKQLPLGRLRGKVLPLLLGDAFWPYMRLWIEVAALAARDDAYFRGVGQAIRQCCRDWVQRQLENNNPGEAARMMTLIEAAILQKAIGLRDAPD